MIDILKKQFNKIFQCIIYIILLCSIYGMWSWSAWELWYVSLIIVLLIIFAGITIGYLWIKSELKKETIIENKE